MGAGWAARLRRYAAVNRGPAIRRVKSTGVNHEGVVLAHITITVSPGC
jgi:hypothetical protein